MSPSVFAVTAVLIGAVSGIASGLFGVGGGIGIVPRLLVFLHLRQHEAHANSLGAVLPIASAAAIPYVTGGFVDPVYAVSMAVSAVFGARIGVRFMSRLDEDRLRLAFACLLLIVAARLALGP